MPWIVQHQDSDRTVIEAIFGIIGQENLDELWISTAWVTEPGLQCIMGPILERAAEQCDIRFLIGANDNFTYSSTTAMNMLLPHSENVNSTFECRVHQAPMFHPKAILAISGQNAAIITGSANISLPALGAQHPTNPNYTPTRNVEVIHVTWPLVPANSDEVIELRHNLVQLWDPSPQLTANFIANYAEPGNGAGGEDLNLADAPALVPEYDNTGDIEMPTLVWPGYFSAATNIQNVFLDNPVWRAAVPDFNSLHARRRGRHNMNTGYVNLIPVAMHFLDWLDEDERQNLLIDLQDNLPIDVTIDQQGGQTSLEFWTRNVNVFNHWSVTNCIRARFVQYVQAMGQTNIVTFVGNRTVVDCVDGCLSTVWGGDVSGGGGHLSALKMGLKLAAHLYAP